MGAKNEILLSRQLVLFEFFLQEFGFRDFQQLQNLCGYTEYGFHTVEFSDFIPALISRAKINPDDLLRYDRNLAGHLHHINSQRPLPLRLKYFQYFPLLFTEYYLHRYFSDKQVLLEELNHFIAVSPRPGIAKLPPYAPDDLNKLAFWSATGSGKTFLLHINYLQWISHAHKDSAKNANLILLTPNEDLSNQHLTELKASGIVSSLYQEDKHCEGLKVIDIHKIKEFSSGRGVTFPLSEFGFNNTLFVDEGHKGSKSQTGAWRDLRNTLTTEGFAFEYSATFGQIADGSLLSEYGKSIVFDYSYGHFYSDGYGKDYWIHNFDDSTLIDYNIEKKRQYLLQNLLLFVQQKLCFDQMYDQLAPLQIEDPLLVFAGSSVEPKPPNGELSKSQHDQNLGVISDVKLVLDFFNDLLYQREKYIQYITHIIQESDEAIFVKDFSRKLEYLFASSNDAKQIYTYCLRYVFNHNVAGPLELCTLTNSEGEIGVKIKGADHYFALIYIGDTGAFRSQTDQKYTFYHDHFSPSLFQSLSHRQSYPVNVLIGARKFIEGWNNYRVSSIGLINFGKSKGSQIIQLFGRGVRLRGRDNSLKRSSAKGNAPDYISIVECLNIFGLKADYMQHFKEELLREGIQNLNSIIQYELSTDFNKNVTTKRTVSVSLKKNKGFLESKKSARLAADPSVEFIIDISTRKFLTDSKTDGESRSTITNNYRLSDDLLDMVDWKWLYSELLLYKKQANAEALQGLVIVRSELRNICKAIHYTIIGDEEFKLGSIADVHKLNKLAFKIFQRYIEKAYLHTWLL
jgi:hypothetical protein